VRCPDPLSDGRAAAIAAAFVIALVAAPAAQALSDHDAAMQFSFAAYRARVALLADKQQIKDRFSRLLPCLLSTVPPPRRARRRVALLLDTAGLDAQLIPARSVLHALVSDLDEVQTTDHALRSGRAAWRARVRLWDQLPDVGDACATLAAWRRGGYDRADTPDVPAHLLARMSSTPVIRRKLAAAAQRMRRLGVPLRDAHRFTGDPLLRGLELFDLTAPPAPDRR